MKKIIEAEINKQINEELFSSYLYLAMAGYAESIDLPGLANWMIIQAQEEVDHAMGFYKHLIERDGRVELAVIKKPAKDFGDIIKMFSESLKHEQHITSRIHHMYDLAQKEKDFPLVSLLKWYIDEQVEEEAKASEWLAKAKANKNNSTGLMFLDKELSTRTYTPGSPQTVSDK